LPTRDAVVVFEVDLLWRNAIP